jgi:two-component system, NtrC family, sensor kinase
MAEPGAGMQIANERVLIVDDEPLVREICARTLDHHGYVVSAVSDASEARLALAAQSFDVLLLDLNIPDTDGLALLEEIRTTDRRLPILMITGSASVEHAAKAMRLGAQGLLLKPFSPTILRDTIADILRQRRDTRVHDRVTALRPVVQISQRLLAELDLPRLHNLIIETVRNELGADRASLMLLEEESQTLRIVALSGLPPNVQLGHRVAVERSLAGWVASQRQLLVVDKRGEVSPPSPHLRGVFAEDNIVSAISVPVIAGERVLGVLNAAKVRTGPIFTEDDQELLVLLAAQAAIAIENARLYTAVSHSEERYRALLQHATDAVLLLDPAGQTILDANMALERLSGYRRDELVQLNPRQLLAELSNWPPQASNGDGAEIETGLHTRWEQTTPVAISISAVPYAGQKLLLVIARDISERQRIAKQLLQAEKLAAIGRLSASMAHEINNPLQAINNAVHLLLTRQLADEKRQRYLEMTRDEVTRLTDIVRRMLDFYRPSREGMRPTDMNELLETVLTLVEGQLQSSKVEVVRSWQAELPMVYAISNHIKQVCFSLLFNALEAMPDGGQLHIRTFTAEEGELDKQGYVSVSGLAQRVSGPAVVIEFSDNGVGMPLEELPKIFEPFYTTRIKGTGLGLAVSYSIIEQHHGELSVRSEVGVGTIFRIKLPVAG